jgi:hypothetical protein
MNRDVDWIRERTNSDIIALVDELTFQIEVEDYKANSRAAYIYVGLANIWGAKMEFEKVSGEPPRRRHEVLNGIDAAMNAAMEKGVDFPK